MGIAAGGLMRQEIYADTFELDDWDIDAADRVFASLVHAKDWKAITGEAAPDEPPSAQDYSTWFDYYGMDQAALPGSKKPAEIGSVAEIFEKSRCDPTKIGRCYDRQSGSGRTRGRWSTTR
jgi:hypothetical protein